MQFYLSFPALAVALTTFHTVSASISWGTICTDTNFGGTCTTYKSASSDECSMSCLPLHLPNLPFISHRLNVSSKPHRIQLLLERRHQLSFRQQWRYLFFLHVSIPFFWISEARRAVGWCKLICVLVIRVARMKGLAISFLLALTILFLPMMRIALSDVLTKLLRMMRHSWFSRYDGCAEVKSWRIFGHGMICMILD